MNDLPSSVSLQIVDGRRAGRGSMAVLAETLPEQAGIYVWTLRLDDNAPAGLKGGARLEHVQNDLTKLRKSRPETPRVQRYRRVEIFDDPRPLTPASSVRLDSLAAIGHTDLSWVLFAGSLFQRPLYVGKALNFRERIPQHFRNTTTFARALNSDHLSLNDCMVTLLPLGSPLGVMPSDPSTAVDSPIDRLIKLAESVVIRTLHPIYNLRMD